MVDVDAVTSGKRPDCRNGRRNRTRGGNRPSWNTTACDPGRLQRIAFGARQRTRISVLARTSPSDIPPLLARRPFSQPHPGNGSALSDEPPASADHELDYSRPPAGTRWDQSRAGCPTLVLALPRLRRPCTGAAPGFRWRAKFIEEFPRSVVRVQSLMAELEPTLLHTIMGEELQIEKAAA